MDGMGYSLAASQRLTQKMSPQQFQAASILQSTVQELRAELRYHQEHNPAIEDIRWKDEPVLSSVIGDPAGGKSFADHDAPLDFTPDGAAASRTLSSDDGNLGEFLGNMQSASTDDSDTRRMESIRSSSSQWDAEREERRQHLFDSAVAAESLEEHLRRQIALSDFTPLERVIAEMVIGNLDDAGYFIGSPADMVMAIGVATASVQQQDHSQLATSPAAAESDVISVQKKICATFDPPGIAARDLRECLLAQMDRFDDSPWEDEIREVVEKHLDALLAGRGEEVRASLSLTHDEWRRLLVEFKLFNRKPALAWHASSVGGRLVDPDAPQYIYPEIHAVKQGGRWKAVVTDGSLPKIVISKEYRRMADDGDLPSDARALIKGYVSKAEELEDMLDERQERLRSVAQAIMDAQPGFFESGLSGLKPLTMSVIAEKVGLDESLVSRAVKGKYMRTPFGVMELRRFFVGGMATAGGGAMTVAQIVERMKALIDAEDKAHPLSDDELAKRLAAEGIPIRRRTVAKYREGAGIMTSGRRRVVSQ